MRLAAYQAPLLPAGSTAALELIGQRVRQCEESNIDLLCCPEAILGGLADDAVAPHSMAIRTDTGELDAMLAPLASDRVATILGFTEITPDGALYNAAAIFERGKVTGIYRKQHPAIRQSVYQAGEANEVFLVNGRRLGLLICNDSNFPGLAADLASRGAELLVIPTNNALRPEYAEVIDAVRTVDAALAGANAIPILRADVAGRTAERISFGSSAITDRSGLTRLNAPAFAPALLVQSLADL